jgi:ribosomal protein S20
MRATNRFALRFWPIPQGLWYHSPSRLGQASPARVVNSSNTRTHTERRSATLARTPRKWQGARNPSGLKRVRQSERRHAILQPRRSAAKTLVAKAVSTATAQPESADVAVALAEAVSALDRAAKTGAIHPNAAARRKSRLAQKINAVVGGTVVVSAGHVAKSTGKAAAAKAAKARIAAGKASKAKGAQTAAGKARAALSRTARSEATPAAAPVAEASATKTTRAPRAAAKATTTKAAPKATTTKATAAKATTAKATTAKAAPKATAKATTAKATAAKAAPKAAAKPAAAKAAPKTTRAKKSE